MLIRVLSCQLVEIYPACYCTLLCRIIQRKLYSVIPESRVRRRNLIRRQPNVMWFFLSSSGRPSSFRNLPNLLPSIVMSSLKTKTKLASNDPSSFHRRLYQMTLDRARWTDPHRRRLCSKDLYTSVWPRGRHQMHKASLF